MFGLKTQNWHENDQNLVFVYSACSFWSPEFVNNTLLVLNETEMPKYEHAQPII